MVHCIASTYLPLIHYCQQYAKLSTNQIIIIFVIFVIFKTHGSALSEPTNRKNLPKLRHNTRAKLLKKKKTKLHKLVRWEVICAFPKRKHFFGRCSNLRLNQQPRVRYYKYLLISYVLYHRVVITACLNMSSRCHPTVPVVQK